MAEGGGLLNRCTGSTRTVSSNLIPSAKFAYNQWVRPRRSGQKPLIYLAVFVPLCRPSVPTLCADPFLRPRAPKFAQAPQAASRIGRHSANGAGWRAGPGSACMFRSS